MRTPYVRTVERSVSMLIVAVVSLPVPGCAIHYFDSSTGTEHLWGVGHMKMKVSKANEGVCAVVTGTTTAGIAVSKHDLRTTFGVGFQILHQLEVLQEGSSIRLEWPTNDLFNVRVGTAFPPHVSACKSRDDGSTEDDE